MKTRTVSVALGTIIFGCCAIAALAADKPNMQAGNWEISIASEMEGMPMAAMNKPITVNRCFKAEDIKDPKSMAESNQTSKNRKCTHTDPKVEGDKISFSFTCEGGTSGTSETTYSGTTYEGTTVMMVGKGPNGQKMKLTQHIKGKRLGDC